MYVEPTVENGGVKLSPSVNVAPGYACILHPTESAEALQRRFLDFVRQALRQPTIWEEPTKHGIQIKGNYTDFFELREGAVLFTTAYENGLPRTIFGNNESVVATTANKFVALSASPGNAELDDIVARFGRHVLNDNIGS